MADDNRNFLLKIITPDRVFFEEEVSMVEFNTVEGEVGIYKNHIPMTMIVAPGILTITQGTEVKEAALHAGFTEVLPDQVTILAEIIEWPSEIDLSRTEKASEFAELVVKRARYLGHFSRRGQVYFNSVARTLKRNKLLIQNIPSPFLLFFFIVISAIRCSAAAAPELPPREQLTTAAVN